MEDFHEFTQECIIEAFPRGVSFWENNLGKPATKKEQEGITVKNNGGEGGFSVPRSQYKPLERGFGGRGKAAEARPKFFMGCDRFQEKSEKGGREGKGPI